MSKTNLLIAIEGIDRRLVLDMIAPMYSDTT